MLGFTHRPPAPAGPFERSRRRLADGGIAALIIGLAVAAATATSAQAAGCGDRRLSVTYVGGPTAILEYRGLRLLTDPTFDPAGRSYLRGTVTLRKLAGPAISREQLGRIDAVLLSHGQHPDNLDDAGKDMLSSAPVVLTTRASAEQLGSPAVGMAPGEERVLTSRCGDRVGIRATEARHGPVGIEPLTGPVIGFVVRDLTAGEDLAYVTGDTVWHEAIARLGRTISPRVVLAFAGAARTARGPFRLTMDASDLVETAHAFPQAQILPLHHDGWAHFSESQAVTIEAFGILALSGRLIRVEPARTYTFEPPGS